MPPLKSFGHKKISELEQSIFLEGDALQTLKILPSESVQCVITSPPYWGVRDYGIVGQIGLEPTLPKFIGRLKNVFREIYRVLRPDGLLWVNIGDCYTSGNRGYRAPDRKYSAREMKVRPDTPTGLKRKDLLGIPWRLAFALQEDGWYLRCDIVWNKPNAMPESVKDRPTRSHEYLFMFSKSEHYLYNHSSVQEQGVKEKPRNLRSVWNVKTEIFNGNHFATFPTELVTPCILASTKVEDFVLDPFAGTGTVGVVSKKLLRKFVGIEINPEYVLMAIERINQVPDLDLDKNDSAIIVNNKSSGILIGDLNPLN